MAQSYFFDGVNKIIQLNNTSSFSILDSYSRWKDWVMLNDNAKYLPAFSYVGGEPTTGLDTLGITYFLTNGWRIRPFNSEEHRLQVEGNLFTTEGSASFIFPTGSFSVLIENKVSNLTDATVLSNPISEGLDYQGYVYIDSVNGYSGSTYPIGTAISASNNTEDAKIIADSFGIKRFLITSNLKIEQPIDGYRWEGITTNTTITATTGSSINNSFFQNLTLTGNISNDNIHATDCVLHDLSGFTGLITQCGLSGSIGILPGLTTFDRCRSEEPGLGSPVFNFNNQTDIYLNVRAYSGGAKYISGSSATIVSTIEFIAGRFTVDNSFTDAYVSVRGIGIINNLGSTATIESASLQNKEYNTELKVNEIWQLHGLDINNPLHVTQMARTFALVSQSINTIGTGSSQETDIQRL